MKHVSSLVNQKPTTSESRGSSTPVADQVVNRLFAVLSGIYGHKWTSQFADDLALKIAKEQWGRHLAGVDMGLVKTALDRCVDDHPQWPPTVGEFKRLCVPDPVAAGMPTASLAWSEICAEGRAYSHGVVLAARNDPRCDVFNWRLLPVGQGLRLFEPIYAEYVSRGLSGEQFELPVMIENKLGKPATWGERKRHAADHLSSIREALRG